MSEGTGQGSGSGTPPVSELRERARHAIRLLAGRQAVLQVLNLGGGIVVARILGPAPLGVFGIAFFVVALAALVADLGTRTALIQQGAPVSERQLATCFTLQLLLATALVVSLCVAAPGIATLYGRAPAELAWIVRILAFDLFLRSCRSMSEVRLERALRYRELAIADVAGSAGYQAVAVGMVVAGWGVESLAWATLTGNAVRVALLFRADPWPVRLVLHAPSVRELVRKGVPLQTSGVIGQIPGWITPTLVAGAIGPEAVGLLTWASTLGRKPLELLENVVRVSLTHFARLQDDVAAVELALVRYATASLLACGLWFAVIAVAGHDLVALVYTERWLPAMPALVLYAGSAMLASVRGLAAASLIGVGRVRTIVRVNAIATAVAVGASVLLVLRIGFLGVPLGQLAGILVATPWLLAGLGAGAPVGVLRGAWSGLKPLLVSLVVGGLCTLVPGETPIRGIVTAGVVSLVYVATAWWVGPGWLRAAAREELALSVGGKTR